jgi:predicted metal-dependent hydrolase
MDERAPSGDAEPSPAALEAHLEAGIRLFDGARYEEAHEEFEELWLANEARDADFFKGLIQACICLHHFQRGNLEGARKLYSGHRRYLASFLPRHRGIDVERLLAELQGFLRPCLRARPGEEVAFARELAPSIHASPPESPLRGSEIS